MNSRYVRHSFIRVMDRRCCGCRPLEEEQASVDQQITILEDCQNILLVL